MLVKAVILDFDGVLCNSEDLHRTSFVDSLLRNGYVWCEKKENIYQANKNKKTVYKLLLLEKAGLISSDDVTNINLHKQELTHERIKESKIDKKVLELLFSIKKDAKLGIASDANKNSILSFLESNQVKNLFDSVVVSDDVGKETKPSHKVYEFCIKNLSVPPDKVAAFEDTEEGCTAAKNAGIKLVFECTHHSLHSKLKDLF
jgi:HAD superfamily hydrolase (TIGR01509 family)